MWNGHTDPFLVGLLQGSERSGKEMIIWPCKLFACEIFFDPHSSFLRWILLSAPISTNEETEVPREMTSKNHSFYCPAHFKVRPRQIGFHCLGSWSLDSACMYLEGLRFHPGSAGKGCNWLPGSALGTDVGNSGMSPIICPPFPWVPPSVDS